MIFLGSIKLTEEDNKSRDIITYGPSSSVRIGELPEGCIRCIKGEKIVLYTTGSCSVGCSYCPIPDDKQEVDSVFVNERAVTLNNQGLDIVFDESEICLATGAGITGGDPMEVPERTIQYIKDLKNKYGDKYHLHLYTSGKFFIDNEVLIDKIFEAGLDELRFHPRNIVARKIWRIAAQAKLNYPDRLIGFEVPCIPQKEKEIEDLILFADENNLDFVNLNEYEFTESNFNKLSQKGFVSILSNAAIQGSKDTAVSVLNAVKDKTSITVHFCSSGSKDSIQLVQRFKKRASQIKRPFDQISVEGELEYGRLVVDNKEEFVEMIDILENEFDLDEEFREDFELEFSVETAWYVIDEIADMLREYFPNLQAEIIARHPIENGPITYIDPR